MSRGTAFIVVAGADKYQRAVVLAIAGHLVHRSLNCRKRIVGTCAGSPCRSAVLHIVNIFGKDLLVGQHLSGKSGRRKIKAAILLQIAGTGAAIAQGRIGGARVCGLVAEEGLPRLEQRLYAHLHGPGRREEIGRPENGVFVHADPLVDIDTAILRRDGLLIGAGRRRSLEELGFDACQLEDYSRAASSPHGMILISGPTGSGKTTTLYATLEMLNRGDNNILTIEDPVEYTLDGINQVQLKEEIGLDFTAALRTFLRQDPDIIMLGEIRDAPTAQMAVRSSLTGHLVLSTLHTNSAWGCTTRLMDMGIVNLLAGTANCENEDEYLTHGSYDFHAARGFHQVARLETVGKKFGRWYDLVWMQKKIGEG